METRGLRSTSEYYAPVKPLCVEKYVTHTFPLERADEATKSAAQRSTMKIQVICSRASVAGESDTAS